MDARIPAWKPRSSETLFDMRFRAKEEYSPEHDETQSDDGEEENRECTLSAIGDVSLPETYTVSAPASRQNSLRLKRSRPSTQRKRDSQLSIRTTEEQLVVSGVSFVPSECNAKGGLLTVL